MKIAVINHSTENLGDDIQRIALEEILPHIDYRIDRENLSLAERLPHESKLIVNGWFSRERHPIWPIKTESDILYIGFHANNVGVIPEHSLLPIGCRDIWTYDLCRKKGLSAWISWCSTLTFQRKSQEKRQGIYFVDLSETIKNSIPVPIIRQAISLSHKMTPNMERNREAKRLVDIYSTASLVVTTRLHAVLPCLAFGTPVVFVPPHSQPYRTASYCHLAWSIENAPWFEMVPKITKEEIRGMALAFRKTVEQFLRS